MSDQWMKLFVVIDVETKEILLVGLTENGVRDPNVNADMLEDNAASISERVADGAYDKFGFRWP